MSDPIIIRINDNDDGTFEVTMNGEPVAKLTAAPMGRRQLSLDVQPVGPAQLRAIAFGADPVLDEDRFTLGPEPNGQIRKGARPFVCVCVEPVAS